MSLKSHQFYTLIAEISKSKLLLKRSIYLRNSLNLLKATLKIRNFNIRIKSDVTDQRRRLTQKRVSTSKKKKNTTGKPAIFNFDVTCH